tara:strand:- start:224 stop:697 length:474 start_codon:yes stop_codon:yes gene_type:complete
MAFMDSSFSRSDIPEDEGGGSFEPIPAGTYDVVVQGIDLRKTKAGTGQYLAVRLDVTGPAHQSRVLWSNINFRNPNPTAEAIGQRQLGELMDAVGLAVFDDTDQLLGGRLKASVIIKDDPQYGRRNEVKKMTSNATALSKTPSSDAAAKSSAPPWAK